MFDHVADRNKLILQYPASWWRNMWREALPAGNGETGAAVYGAIKKETILINHSGLWHMGVKGELPDVSHTLKETRELMDQGKFDQANWHLTKEVKKRDYFAKLASPLPLGDLQVEMNCEAGFSDYSRGINMETGEVCVSWKEKEKRFTRSLFVSHFDNIIVYKIEANTKNSINAKLGICLHPTDTPRIQDRYDELMKTVGTIADNHYFYYKATNEDGADFGAVARIIAEGGEQEAEQGNIRCFNSTSLTVLVKVFVDGDSEQQWSQLRDELDDMDGNYEKLLNSHLEIYQPLYFSSALRITSDEQEHSNEELLLQAYKGKAPSRLIEKLWSYGRYLFISGTKPGCQPFAMYGLWHGDYQLMWSHRMANENIQMMYWHASVGGLSEYNLSLVDYYIRLMDDFRDNAMKLFGCRGIYIPAGSTPGIGKPNQLVPVIMSWTSAAGWLAQHFYEYYQFSGDQVFLKEKALPFMKEVAMFYHDFLVVGEGGLYQYYPSVSPENTPANYMPQGNKQVPHPMPTTINATMDFAIMKELLANLIEGSSHVSLYEEEVPAWQDMLGKIPDYQLNHDGSVREWMNEQFDDNEEHRHLSHIYPVFPGREVVKEKNEVLFESFQKAVQKRKLGAQTSWSFAHMASIYARLEDGNRALLCLDRLSRACLLNNLYTVHNDWRNMGLSMEINYAPVQLDANLGIVNAVQEMLFYVSTSMIRFLPALPADWIEGRVCNFHFFTGKVNFDWNVSETMFSAEIVSVRTSIFTICLPKYLEDYEWIGEGEVSMSEYGERYLDIKMKPNQTLKIQSTTRRGDMDA
ncbi:glycosyl hydrolase family 95 catalytic domain-containing protein [Gracilibacillus xinjiangensis]|uniref:Glycoside hydrolase N-terminal domain-containing protein n=1 Tax=Gracilibacillus xinjiangensis TaxID=1193282 RepID=A0ABV8WQM3_9BACI